MPTLFPSEDIQTKLWFIIEGAENFAWIITLVYLFAQPCSDDTCGIAAAIYMMPVPWVLGSVIFNALIFHYWRKFVKSNGSEGSLFIKLWSIAKWLRAFLVTIASLYFLYETFIIF